MDIFVFPGQGAQRVGMGGRLFHEVDEFRSREQEIDQMLGYSLRKLCLEDSNKVINITTYTQPALYVVNALHYYKALSNGLRPRLLAGHSLGEYNALLAAGVIDFITGLRLVIMRGELMNQANNGGMAAVIGIKAEAVTQIINDHGLAALDIANYNSPAQTVISGPTEEIHRAGPIFERYGAERYIPLPVSAAFHSRYMEDIAKKFEDFVAGIEFHDPEIPVISNVNARPYKKGDPTATRELLVKQISSPVQWTNTVAYLIGRGASKFHEIGPGDVLTRLIQQIRQR